VAVLDRSRVIAATPTQIWNVLADFGAVSRWMDRVDHSCILASTPDMIGTTRRIQLGRTVLVERITEFDEQFALAYDVEGLPRILGRVSNRWTLEATGGGETVVTIHTTATPPVRLLMAASAAAMLADLADYLEGSHV